MRFPQSVFSLGVEPDVRFSLANERTFLAWIRTSLALLAGGVALELLGLDLQRELRLSASLLLIGAGIAVPLVAWREWVGVERALRLSRPLPRSPLGFVLTLTITISGTLVALSVVLR